MAQPAEKLRVGVLGGVPPEAYHRLRTLGLERYRALLRRDGGRSAGSGRYLSLDGGLRWARPLLEMESYGVGPRADRRSAAGRQRFSAARAELLEPFRVDRFRS